MAADGEVTFVVDSDDNGETGSNGWDFWSRNGRREESPGPGHEEADVAICRVTAPKLLVEGKLTLTLTTTSRARA